MPASKLEAAIRALRIPKSKQSTKKYPYVEFPSPGTGHSSWGPISMRFCLRPSIAFVIARDGSGLAIREHLGHALSEKFRNPVLYKRHNRYFIPIDEAEEIFNENPWLKALYLEALELDRPDTSGDFRDDPALRELIDSSNERVAKLLEKMEEDE